MSILLRPFEENRLSDFVAISSHHIGPSIFAAVQEVAQTKESLITSQSPIHEIRHLLNDFVIIILNEGYKAVSSFWECLIHYGLDKGLKMVLMLIS